MRKTNAALLQEISRLDAELIRYRESNMRITVERRKLCDELYRQRNEAQWHRNINQRLIDAVCNFAGIKGGTI